ncbi:hypothetical protein M408DRAFT_101229 [Serendipita vermifera MAFF 305830]|uniref:Alpha/beta hydrolase fold-3 domain-containing protein n=1 Tax=Serendipita vermifera MAFF 305830 TaxID=933852 RepID=A0A0C3BFB4_SERVB|nr:hypothetical protein M408DRAFT_101229 [Serendipita vermifera MAFF 305830]
MIKFPLGARFDLPEKYGLAPGRTLNINIQTPDNITLGAWFVFSEDYYQNAASLDATSEVPVSLTETDIAHALHSHHTILYFHGNAATRAVSHRVRFYSQWTSRIRANVLAIDYRGFGDSQGSPSEAGLGIDGRAAWNWLTEHGARPKDILLFGQSLGTAVVAKVAHELSSEGIRPRGAVMSGAFTDLATLLETYNIGGFLPLLQPFQLVPFFFKALDRVLYHKLSTISILPEVTCPILLIHGEDDFDIQIFHSQRLFDAVLESYLEPFPLTKEQMAKVNLETDEQRQLVDQVSGRRRQQREAMVKETNVQSLGKILSFKRPDKGDVTLLRSTWGGHNQIINFEGVMDVVRKLFEL